MDRFEIIQFKINEIGAGFDGGCQYIDPQLVRIVDRTALPFVAAGYNYWQSLRDQFFDQINAEILKVVGPQFEHLGTARGCKSDLPQGGIVIRRWYGSH